MKKLIAVLMILAPLAFVNCSKTPADCDICGKAPASTPIVGTWKVNSVTYEVEGSNTDVVAAVTAMLKKGADKYENATLRFNKTGTIREGDERGNIGTYYFGGNRLVVLANGGGYIEDGLDFAVDEISATDLKVSMDFLSHPVWSIEMKDEGLTKVVLRMAATPTKDPYDVDDSEPGIFILPTITTLAGTSWIGTDVELDIEGVEDAEKERITVALIDKGIFILFYGTTFRFSHSGLFETACDDIADAEPEYEYDAEEGLSISEVNFEVVEMTPSVLKLKMDVLGQDQVVDQEILDDYPDMTKLEVTWTARRFASQIFWDVYRYYEYSE